ncbi:hypothetical protein CTA1_8189 [Colletotrichum tanaceti]|uniref:Uncharacterized protein n=1 Tax=Colletotrichum tanaceti TaxID=1306861 RepID=A0A4U6XDV9_9PEZI|nr:hypothetical protein CTA1_8189 [Colletotrichum tanaceti]
MKLSSIAIIVTAAAGVAGVPVDSGPLDNLESRAADAIGGVVHYIRREQAGTSVAPVIKRAPPIRFRSVLEHENDLRRRAAQNEPPTPVLEPTPMKLEGGLQERSAPDLTRRSPAAVTSVPPLAPFLGGRGDGKRDLSE